MVKTLNIIFILLSSMLFCLTLKQYFDDKCNTKYLKTQKIINKNYSLCFKLTYY